jgi:hypothetical protein
MSLAVVLHEAESDRRERRYGNKHARDNKHAFQSVTNPSRPIGSGKCSITTSVLWAVMRIR